MRIPPVYNNSQIIIIPIAPAKDTAQVAEAEKEDGKKPLGEITGKERANIEKIKDRALSLFLPSLRKKLAEFPVELKMRDPGNLYYGTAACGGIRIFVQTREGGWFIHPDEAYDTGETFIHEYLHAFACINVLIQKSEAFRKLIDRAEKEKTNPFSRKTAEEYLRRTSPRLYELKEDPGGKFHFQKWRDSEIFAHIGAKIVVENAAQQKKIPKYMIDFFRKIFVPEVF